MFEPEAASQEAADRFLERHALSVLPAEDRPRALSLMEMLVHRHAMFTSCGWFFDDISGIETAQILKQAARAVEIAEVFGAVLTAEFKRRLSLCQSNIPSLPDGAAVYDKLVLPSAVSPERLAAHWAILSHLRASLASCPPGWRVEAGTAARAKKQGPAGRDRGLTAQRLEVTRLSTLESRTFTAVTHQRDRLDVTCRLGKGGTDATELFTAFEKQNDDEFERTLSSGFGAAFATLEALLPEDRAETLRWLTPDPVGGAAKREFLDMWVAAMGRLRGGATQDELLPLFDRARALKLPLARLPWAFEVRRALRALLETLLDGADEAALSRAGRWLEAFEKAGLHVDLWELQHLFWRWRARLAARPSSPAERRLAAALGAKLGFADAALPVDAPA
jgi:hypothetical protein